MVFQYKRKLALFHYMKIKIYLLKQVKKEKEIVPKTTQEIKTSDNEESVPHMDSNCCIGLEFYDTRCIGCLESYFETSFKVDMFQFIKRNWQLHETLYT